jgi:predicted DNA-binding protein (UPF0278 family)
MTLRRFVSKHRKELREAIRSTVPNIGPLSLADLEDWVANDETLYKWALFEGVRF